MVKSRIWYARVAGLLILGAGLGTLAAADPSFPISAALIVSVALYVFVSEYVTRRMVVGEEKRLRLGLLVRNMELENMAMQDDLTQLFNRRYFFERLERELESARSSNRALSVMVLDLDGMKQVNDGFGHRAGDDLLAAFGKLLLSVTRASDVPARIGGDEFAVILPDTPDRSALALKERLTRKLAEAPLVEGVSVPVTASFGVSAFPTAGATVDLLIQQADLDMYQEKNLRKAEHDTAAAAAKATA